MKGIFVVVAMVVFLLSCGQPTLQASQFDEGEILNLTFARLENDHQAKIGVYALDTESNKTVSYHADDRFAYCSTSKVLMVGAVLRQESLEGIKKTVTYTQKDILSYAPITAKYVETGMTLEEICSAALRVSDNTAANLLLAHIGGIDGFKMSLRQIGDMVTEPSRNEPMLNEAVPGDWRDTSTPHQLAVDFQSYILGDVLTAEKKNILVSWMSGNKNTDTLIRAGMQTDWIVADKSGTGGYGTRNDVAIITPPGRKPIILAILTTHNDKNAKADDQLLAEIARIIGERFKKI